MVWVSIMPTDPLRILHLVSYPLWSGALAVTASLARRQRELGHTVHLLHGSASPRTPYEPAVGDRLRDFRPPEVGSFSLDPRGGPLEVWGDVRRLSRLLREGGYQVLHVHLNHDHVVARLAGARRYCKLVRTAHARRSVQPRMGQAWMNAYADAWLVRCEQHAAALRRMAPGMTTRVIGGEVDLEHFRPPSPQERAAARQRLGLPADARVVLQAALMAYRGQEELAGAAVRLNSERLHLIYAGRGEHEEALRLLCDGIGLRGKAHFVGYLDEEALVVAHHAADLCYVGAPGNDASQRGALQAFACARPVLGKSDEALGEMLDPSRGYPAPELSPSAIAAALKTWWDDEEGGRSRGVQARRWVERERPVGHEASRTLKLYASLLDGAEGT